MQIQGLRWPAVAAVQKRRRGVKAESTGLQYWLVAAVERRFDRVNRAPVTIEWL
jgi:hypothetical protein